MSLKHGVVALVVILCAGLIQACMDDADAQTSGGSTIARAEFDALLARVTALEANQPGDKVFAAVAQSGALAKAASAAGKPLGTMVGHLPSNLPVSRSQFFSLKSSTGYLYAVSNERNSKGLAMLASYAGTGDLGRPVYFASGDCSGTAHVPALDVSDYGASQGLAFMIGAGEFNEIIDDPAQYLYIAAGTERTAASFDYGSRTSRVGFCEVLTGSVPQGAYPALLNDPTITGVDSGPVAAPVRLETAPGA